MVVVLGSGGGGAVVVVMTDTVVMVAKQCGQAMPVYRTNFHFHILTMSN